MHHVLEGTGTSAVYYAYLIHVGEVCVVKVFLKHRSGLIGGHADKIELMAYGKGLRRVAAALFCRLLRLGSLGI